MLIPAAIPPALTVARALSSWTAGAAGIAVAGAGSAGYAAGVYRVRRTGGSWPWARVAAFAAGLAVVVLATCSAVGVYDRTLFTAYLIQLVLLLMMAPLLLSFGAPFGLAARAWPSLARPLDRVRFAGSAPVGFAILFVVPLAVFFTGWLGATLRHPALLQGDQAGLVILGTVGLWSLGEVGEVAAALAYPIAAFLAFIELLADAIPGIAVRLNAHLLAPVWYLGLHRTWGMSPMADQHLGGSILWGVAELSDLPLLGILVHRWIRAEEQEAVRIDRELDEREAALAYDADEPLLMRPWWEQPQ